MMNPVEELRQVQVNHRPIACFQVSGRFGDRCVGTAVRAETVTTAVEGWFIDQLEYLQHDHSCCEVDDVNTLGELVIAKADPTSVLFSKVNLRFRPLSRARDLPQPHPRPSVVPGDELHAGCLEGRLIPLPNRRRPAL
jgi:hypothetical protein